MVHRACKRARACVPAEDPVAFTTDVRPNISGSIKPFGVACSDFIATGALSGGKSSTPWNGKTNVGSKVIDDITFNASRSNGTYGSSTTVQPSSARMTAFIKI